MADRYLLETSATDGYQLEDGSGVLILEGVTITGIVAQSQAKQQQSATGTESMLGIGAQSQAEQAQAITVTESMLGTGAQGQAAQEQAAIGSESMLGAIAQEQEPQKQSGTGIVLVSVTGMVVQSQALQTQAAIGSTATAPAVGSGGGALPLRYYRRGPKVYITVPDEKKKRRKVAPSPPPKSPEPDRRIEIGLKHLRRLSSIRLEPVAVKKIDHPEIRQAVHAVFAVSGKGSQASIPAIQSATGKVTRPDYEKALEEMLLLWTA